MQPVQVRVRVQILIALYLCRVATNSINFNINTNIYTWNIHHTSYLTPSWHFHFHHHLQLQLQSQSYSHHQSIQLFVIWSFSSEFFWQYLLSLPFCANIVWIWMYGINFLQKTTKKIPWKIQLKTFFTAKRKRWLWSLQTNTKLLKQEIQYIILRWWKCSKFHHNMLQYQH